MNNEKYYPVLEQVFINHELVEVADEMWTKQQILKRINQMKENGYMDFNGVTD